MTLFKWFNSKGYPQGVFWAIQISVFSVTNDTIMCFLGNRLPTVQISFFRFLFSMLSVLPVMLFLNKGSCFKRTFETKNLKAHIARASVGAIALGLCCYAVHVMPLSENTAILFSQPLFFLPLAAFFLKEKIGFSRFLATGLGFLGLLVIVNPDTKILESKELDSLAFIPTIAAFLFAVLDIMAKKMIVKENPLTLLFYFGLFTTILSGIFVPFFWKTPTLSEIFILFFLGIGGNLIQVCLFKAFSATDASSLMPFRYVEFLFSSAAGFLFFHQIPSTTLISGALLIVLSTFYISFMETRKEAIS
jgi:S-adenosylmethionine uptake transporter